MSVQANDHTQRSQQKLKHKACVLCQCSPLVYLSPPATYQADLQLARQQAELSAAKFEQQLGEATAELAERERQVASLQSTAAQVQCGTTSAIVDMLECLNVEMLKC